ncbi:MAG: hypothetical protein KY446_11375 [Proteobacteria bacterium]|nr:hypothetical protein [Pseudomonadota bacterium]
MSQSDFPTPETNITEEGEPGDLAGAAQDTFGGDHDGAEDIAADDAGTGALEGHVGVTAGGQAPLGVGGQSGLATKEEGAAVIAADDAGAGRAAADVAADGSGAD